MSKHANSGLPALMLFVLTLLNAGCDTGPQAEFKFRETTTDLVPEAFRAVKKTLGENFGTPNKIVAWERFPINYGGVKGVVTAIGSDSVVVKLDDEAAEVKSDSPLLWLSGTQAGTKTAEVAISRYDALTGQLTLAKGAATPSIGDQFVIAHGEAIRLGRVVYMKNCMHCHGVTGDGEGPTGKFLNPRPRDYRNGQFKFTGTKPGEKITKDDLDRIVRYGIPGTYMPSFLLLGDKETQAVVEYVRWLATRGEFEKRLVADLSSDYSIASVRDTVDKEEAAYQEMRKDPAERANAVKPAGLAKAKKAAGAEFLKFEEEKEYEAVIEETANLLAEAWSRAEEPDSLVLPSIQRVEDTAESRERGRLLYMSDKTKCYTCHGPTGRGDGAATEDFWPMPGSNDKYPNRGLHDEWGNPLKPRNLLQGQYRGGRRPLDIFRRMYAGIKGTPMPAFGGTALKDEELWDLVNYVMSLPYQQRQSSLAAHKTDDVAKSEEKPGH
ncbi:c-type cytochrome [Schlesneria sp. T3-172]|uniref:c-type cytochrome n=1 Tax=Schlesneria sphaerica TaxID=3373610 RepID=UPI0037C8BDF2